MQSLITSLYQQFEADKGEAPKLHLVANLEEFGCEERLLALWRGVVRIGFLRPHPGQSFSALRPTHGFQDARKTIEIRLWHDENLDWRETSEAHLDAIRQFNFPFKLLGRLDDFQRLLCNSPSLSPGHPTSACRIYYAHLQLGPGQRGLGAHGWWGEWMGAEGMAITNPPSHMMEGRGFL